MMKNKSFAVTHWRQAVPAGPSEYNHDAEQVVRRHAGGPWSCVSNPWSYVQVGQPLLGQQRSLFRQRRRRGRRGPGPGDRGWCH